MQILCPLTKTLKAGTLAKNANRHSRHTNSFQTSNSIIMSNVSDIIDSVIHSGYMTSVDVYKTFEDSEAERKYILKYHLDEELEAYLGM